MVTLVGAIPGLLHTAAAWISDRSGRSIDLDGLATTVDGGAAAIAPVVQSLAGGLVTVVAAVLNAAFSSLTFAFFTFYLSAHQPRLRRWAARLAPPRQQEVLLTVWDVAARKTGGYVAARLVLASICGGLSAAFMLVIGMPYWLALGVWTGLVAQFVPTVGTYIAIALPVLVGLTGDQPWQGLAMLVFAIVYQQVENLFLEPRISAQAVDLHPAVSFAAVMLGASLFGVGGAFVAVPVASLLVALLEIYARKYELVPESGARAPAPAKAKATDEARTADADAGQPDLA